MSDEDRLLRAADDLRAALVLLQDAAELVPESYRGCLPARGTMDAIRAELAEAAEHLAATADEVKP